MSSPSGSVERVAAIVPAWNEEKTVGAVVRVLKAVRGLDEVVVVDDGSTDRTAEAAASAGADRVVRLPENLGKGDALRRGVASTDAGTLFFCDADLIGLTPAHVERLLAPVRKGRLAMCTGLRDRGPLLAGLIARLPSIAGERALRREVFEAVPDRFLRRFRVEIALAYACRAGRLACAGVPTIGLTQVRKTQKVGFFRGLAAYVRMIWEIVSVFILVRFSKKEFLFPHEA